MFWSVVIPYHILYTFPFLFFFFFKWWHDTRFHTVIYLRANQYWNQDLNFVHQILFLHSLSILPTDVDFCSLSLKHCPIFNFLTSLWSWLLSGRSNGLLYCRKQSRKGTEIYDEHLVLEACMKYKIDIFLMKCSLHVKRSGQLILNFIWCLCIMSIKLFEEYILFLGNWFKSQLVK